MMKQRYPLWHLTTNHSTPQDFSCEFQRLRLGSLFWIYMGGPLAKQIHPPGKSGAFITFEGPEGSGKTTQCRHLARWLTNRGYSVLLTREPGGTPLAEAIRKLLLSETRLSRDFEQITPACETALILAARSQHVTHVILPALQKGIVVVCDRFFDSTLAYQGFGRGLNRKALTAFNTFATHGLEPTITFLLDIPVKEGLERRRHTHKQNRLDRESLAFHERVRRGFLTLARQDPSRWKKLDARKSPQELAQTIANLVQSLFAATSPPGRSEAKHNLRRIK
jgi:dTMP kinase